MSDPVIHADGIRKRYRLGKRPAYRTLRDAIVGAPARMTNRSGPRRGREWFWALDGVSFEIEHGGVVGIIGRNGAGKSTLLKILSRITRPTEGHVEIRGRVGSLLEVGTGFHPELSGRENVYLNGAILGMTKKEIERRFDEIVAFAGTERFVDTQVKHYSSGMQVRLAFAVAAHLDPEILLVDEVLAVGDAAFQRKCLGRMDEVAREGRTVLFVSHNMGAIVRLCQRAFWIDQGTIVADGQSRRVVDDYLNADLEGEGERRWDRDPPGDEHLQLRAARICQPEGILRRSVDLSQPFDIEIDLVVPAPRPERDVIALRVIGRDGQVVLHSAEVWTDGVSRRSASGLWRTTCRVPPHLLNAGTYTLALGADVPQSRTIFEADNILAWTIEAGGPQPGNYDPRSWAGTVGPAAVGWSTRQESPSDHH